MIYKIDNYSKNIAFKSIESMLNYLKLENEYCELYTVENFNYIVSKNNLTGDRYTYTYTQIELI